MKKTLPMMAKAALVTLLAWGGLAQADAQQGNRHTIVSQDYESATETDWSNHSESGTYNISTDNTTGINKCAYNANTNTSTDGYVHAYKSVSLDDEIGQGYADANLKQKGYVVAFDFAMFPPTVKTTHHVLQLIVSTEEKPTLTNDGKYGGSDYIFALQSHQISNQGSSTTLVTTYYRANDLSKDGFGIRGTNDSYDFQLTSGNWYHLELVVTADSCSYTITPKDNNKTVTTSGMLTFQGQNEVPIVRSVLAVLGKAKSAKRPCYLKFDNFEVFDYVADATARTATEPTIAWKETTENSVKYTITFRDGDVLYYQLPGQTNYTSVDTGTSVEVEVTQSGTLEAYTMYANTTSGTTTTSSTTKEDVKIFTADISEASGLCSFSGAKDTYTRVPDDVTIYQVTLADNQNLNATTAVLKKVTGFQSGMQFINANAGVFLYKEGGGQVTLPFVPEQGIKQADVSLYDDNQLRSTCDDAKTVPEFEGEEGVTVGSSVTYYYFCLKKNEAALARVKVGVKIPAHKAYLKIRDTAFSSSGNANLSLVFEDDDATGVSSVKGEEESVKNQAALYNLAGQRVDSSYKGLVVKNGKKYWNR